MSGKRKYFLLVTLFLFALTFVGATPKNKISVSVVYNNEIVLSGEYEVTYDNFFSRLFGVNIKNKINKLKDKGYQNDKILRKMFPTLYKDIILTDREFYVEPLSASVNFNAKSLDVFTYNDEKIGRAIDREKLTNDIVNSLNNKKIVVNLEVNKLSPEIFVDDLKKVTVKRGEFATKYGFSSQTRKNNIERASSIINGTIIRPNEVFSFNSVVGPRTAERGFQEAPIIVDGRYVGGIGGGVCQVSTTLYNAVLYADLPVLAVNRHTLPVRYVAPSFDAMVSSASDLKFINNTQNDIYIQSKFNGSDIRFIVYGAPREYDVSLFSEKIKDIPCEIEIIGDDTMFKGDEKVLFEGADGLMSRGYIIKKQQGKFISKTLIRRDTYIARNRVVVRGLKEPINDDIDNQNDLI